MSLVTTTEMQALGVGLALSTAQLQTVIDREEALVVSMFGANYTGAAVSETLHGGGSSLYLKRAAGSISSIVEYLYPGDTAPTTLTSADYYLWPSEGRIERLPWGASASMKWGTPVTVSYIPVDDTNLRKEVLIALVQIAINEVSPIAAGKSVSGLGYSITNGSGIRSTQAARGDQYARLGWLSR